MKIAGYNIPFFRGKVRISTKANYQLTPLGKTKIEGLRVEGPKADLMLALDDNSPCTIPEAANDAKMSVEKAKRIMKVLVQSGYVRRVGSEE